MAELIKTESLKDQIKNPVTDPVKSDWTDRNLLKIDQQTIWHPFTQMRTATDPVVIERGEGALLFDSHGNSLIDAISSWWVNLHGHCHPQLADAMSEQARRLEQVIFAGYTHKPAVNLASRLLDLMPTMDRVFFSDNGSTAVEVALKMALQYWFNKGEQRKKIVAFEGAYHGDTFGAMSVGDGGVFSEPFAALLFDCERIPFPTPENIETVEEQLATICRSGEIAAFIYEPIVQGVAGFRMCPPGHLDRLVSIARTAEVLCIADEVMTGFGRTGPIFATDLGDVKPDLMCLSKGITGGTMPLAVTLCTKKLFEAFLSKDPAKAFFHGHSYTANPVACHVADASLDLLMEPTCKERRSTIAHRFRREQAKFADLDQVKDARSLGCIFALDLATGENSYFNEVRQGVGPFFQERGILLRPLGNTLYVLPPYCITDEQLDHVFGTIREFIDGLG